jgi:DNA recombination protein RmuC
MEVLIVILLVVVLAVVVAAVAFVLSESRENRRTLESQLSAQRNELAQSVGSVQQALQQRIEGIDDRLNKSLTASSTTMQEIGKQLEGVRNKADQMLEVGKDISSLQDLLKPPTLRGGFGETLLEQLLAQILPQAHYTIQHRFKSGEAVDAAIRLGKGAADIVPVDAKFPMESFHRTLAATSEEERTKLRREFVRVVKGHIDAVAKYIRPDEGTFNFALMYIPAENVYYETIIKDEFASAGGSIHEYAMQKGVMPVSPNSLYPYLQVIVRGLKGMQVEKRAQEMVEHVERLQGDFGRIQEEFRILGGHVHNASRKYDDLEKIVGRFGDKLSLPLGEEWQQLPPGEASNSPE